MTTRQQMNKELKACPFCGGQGRLEQEYEEGWHVECISCEARTREFFSGEMTAEALEASCVEAIAAWNRRYMT